MKAYVCIDPRDNTFWQNDEQISMWGPLDTAELYGSPRSAIAGTTSCKAIPVEVTITRLDRQVVPVSHVRECSRDRGPRGMRLGLAHFVSNFFRR